MRVLADNFTMADGSNASERAWYDNAHMNLDIVQIRGMRFVAHALKISEKAIEQSGILEDGRNTDWLNHPSIRLTILALAYLHGSDRRRNGGKLEITHQIAMAHNMANDPDLAGQLDTSRHRAFRAMKALIHDVQERVREINELKTHHRELDPEKILQAIVDYWDGTHFGRNELMRSGDHMTDRPGFTGAARIQNQADRTPTANQQDQHVRFYDKYDQASGDHAHFKQYLVDLQSGVIEPTLKELHQVTLAVRHAATK
ncbi:MAG TPA: hypothetical protein VFR09_03160, partial [Alphaproteobacteria bacterium]|nr:hypothetical protein [Alphaproteobacteria bacterium]